jgi:hypothetical protein
MLMKKCLIFLGGVWVAQIFSAELPEKKKNGFLKPPAIGVNGSNGSNGKGLKRALSDSRLKKIQEKRAKEIQNKQAWYFKFPGEIKGEFILLSEFATGDEIRDILTKLRSLWEDDSRKPALEYFRYFLKDEFPKSYDLKDKEKYDKILFESKLIESNKSIKRVVKLVCQAALLEPGKLLLWKDLTNKKIIQSAETRKEEKEKIMEYDISGELFVFKISPEHEEEFQTTENSIKKTYKQFSELNEQEKLFFETMLTGDFWENIADQITVFKNKINSAVRDYYKNNIPQKIEETLIKLMSTQDSAGTLADLKKEIAKEDSSFVERVENLSNGIAKETSRLEKGEKFRLRLKEMGLIRENESIPYIVRFLWKALLKRGFSGEVKLMPLAEAYKEGRIYKKNHD